MHQPRTQADAPQGCGANLIPGAEEAVERKFLPGNLIDVPAVVFLHRHDDAVAGPYVVQQEVPERVESLFSERGRNRERASVDRRARGPP